MNDATRRLLYNIEICLVRHTDGAIEATWVICVSTTSLRTLLPSTSNLFLAFFSQLFDITTLSHIMLAQIDRPFSSHMTTENHDSLLPMLLTLYGPAT